MSVSFVDLEQGMVSLGRYVDLEEARHLFLDGRDACEDDMGDQLGRVQRRRAAAPRSPISVLLTVGR